MQRRRARAKRPRAARDDGFTLLEMIISMVIITVIMAALTGLFVNGISTSGHLRKVQTATRLATSSLDFARSIGAIGAKKNRSAAQVSAQFNGFAGTPVSPWLTGMTPTVDASPTGTADLPATPTAQVVDGVTYQVSYLVGTCLRASSLAATSQACGTVSGSAPTVQFVRVVVAVSWNDRSCKLSSCYFATATLLNGDADPQFNFRIDPPPPPTLSNCVDQNVFVGQLVNIPVFPAANLGSASAAICALAGGTPSFDWLAPTLPAGLTLDSVTGLISGTVAAPDPSKPDLPVPDVKTTITVNDGQSRASTSSFTWHIFAATMQLVGPASILAQVGQPTGALPVSIKGGSGQFSLAVANAPGWIQLSGTSAAGFSLGGTPAAGDAGSGTINLTATDSLTRQAASFAIPFLVTTASGPAVSTPGDKIWAAGQPVSMDVSATCANGISCAWSAPVGLPAGLTWQAAPAGDTPGQLRGTIAGTPTGASSGTVVLSASDNQQGVGGSLFRWQVTP